jgi:hypothetical protein
MGAPLHLHTGYWQPATSKVDIEYFGQLLRARKELVCSCDQKLGSRYTVDDIVKLAHCNKEFAAGATLIQQT